MIPIRTIRRLACVLTGLAAAALALAATAPAALAMTPLPAGGPIAGARAAPRLHTVADGMPGWQVTLIAAGAALLAASLAVLLDRARVARRRTTVPSG